MEVAPFQVLPRERLLFKINNLQSKRERYGGSRFSSSASIFPTVVAPNPIFHPPIVIIYFFNTFSFGIEARKRRLARKRSQKICAHHLSFML